MMKNPTHRELAKTFRQFNTFAIDCSEKGETVMFFIYYAGHGVLDSTTYAVLDSDEPKKWRFGIERYIRILGGNYGCFCIGLLDCCREKLPTIAPMERSNSGASISTLQSQMTMMSSTETLDSSFISRGAGGAAAAAAETNSPTSW